MSEDLMRSCKNFDNCNASLCPFDRDPGLERRIWFPNEEICTRRNMPKWVKKQKRIARKTTLGFEAGYFTITDLMKGTKVTKTMRGRQPDDPEPKENARLRDEIILASEIGTNDDLEIESNDQEND